MQQISLTPGITRQLNQFVGAHFTLLSFLNKLGNILLRLLVALWVGWKRAGVNERPNGHSNKHYAGHGQEYDIFLIHGV